MALSPAARPGLLIAQSAYSILARAATGEAHMLRAEFRHLQAAFSKRKGTDRLGLSLDTEQGYYRTS
jgi:hypothetical protein